MGRSQPREKESNFETIRMGFGFSGLEIMELTDTFGQTTVLKFTALRRNRHSTRHCSGLSRPRAQT